MQPVTILVGLCAVFAGSVAAQNTCACPSATSAAPSASPTYGTAAKNLIYAQYLVNCMLAKHPEVTIIGLHCTPPGGNDEVLFATNLDRIGKSDDDDDRAVATGGKTIAAPNVSDPTKFEVATPFMAKYGVNCSSNFVFQYNASTTYQPGLWVKAREYSDAIEANVMQYEDLFKPVKSVTCKVGK